ncbi:MAG: PIN domain-containing protein [Micropepsaceae bacterium]
MIAADTSSIIEFLKGSKDIDALAVQAAVETATLCLPAVVVTELLSDHKAAPTIEPFISKFTRLDPTDGYWERAGLARRQLLARGLKARLGDALAAQACIDHGVVLIARDKDFRHFVTHLGLKLA